MTRAALGTLRWQMACEIDAELQHAIWQERFNAQGALCQYCAAGDTPHLIAGDWVHGPKGLTMPEVADLAHSDRSAALIHPCGAVALMKLWCQDVVRARELDGAQVKEFWQGWQSLFKGDAR
jgi:hypothetical protein